MIIHSRSRKSRNVCQIQTRLPFLTVQNQIKHIVLKSVSYSLFISVYSLIQMTKQYVCGLLVAKTRLIHSRSHTSHTILTVQNQIKYIAQDCIIFTVHGWKFAVCRTQKGSLIRQNSFCEPDWDFMKFPPRKCWKTERHCRFGL